LNEVASNAGSHARENTGKNCCGVARGDLFNLARDELDGSAEGGRGLGCVKQAGFNDGVIRTGYVTGNTCGSAIKEAGHGLSP
jgi:hypothetical protein